MSKQYQFNPSTRAHVGTQHPTLPNLTYMEFELEVIGDEKYLGSISGYIEREAISLVSAAPDLLALAEKYASECAECGGEGLVTLHTHQGGIDIDAEDQPCRDCADIRAVIAKATQS